jgi:hypothetical protein
LLAFVLNKALLFAVVLQDDSRGQSVDAKCGPIVDKSVRREPIDVNFVVPLPLEEVAEPPVEVVQTVVGCEK